MTLKSIIILISFICIITFLTSYNGIIGIHEASLYAQELSSVFLSTMPYTPLITFPFEHIREYGLILFDEEGNLYWGATLPANYHPLPPIPKDYEMFLFQNTWISDSNPLPARNYYSFLFQNTWISDSNPVPPIIPIPYYYIFLFQNTWISESEPLPPVIPIPYYYCFLFQNTWISDSDPLPPIIPIPYYDYSFLFQNAWISDANPLPPGIPNYGYLFQDTWISDANPMPPDIIFNLY